ncbi:MAG TPA: c-type cytochrome [Pyrinomonadaceae bacterium]|nr:c-type cytochrome [Pyrinomonadaceae bacterium]
MADAPEASESLVKKEPEAVQAHDPIVSRSTSGMILLSALLLTISLAWALWDEAFGQRPWKNIQQEFVSRYTRYLRSIKPQAGQTEAQLKESPEYQALDAETKAAEEQVGPEISEIDQKVRHIDAQLTAVTDPFQNQRGHLTVITYNLETAKPTSKDKYRRQIEEKRQEVVPVELPAADGKTSAQRMNYEQLEKLYNDLRDEKAVLLGRKAELLKGPGDLRKKRDDYLKNQLIGLRPDQVDSLIRGLENFDYSILGHQISIDSGRVVDRCEVCHVGIRQPLTIKASHMAPDGPGKTPDSLARAFVSHPKRELLEIHKPERFGCSGCHWGNGRATTSEVKGHGRHRFWLWPLFQKENMEAGCQQCHAKDRVTQGADTLNLGRDLFNERGCVGCHRYEGFDRETDALNGTRQLITQLDDQMTANEKQMREETALADDPNTDEDEVPKLRAHAESLRVANSLLAARKDQLNLQSKYLMQDQKKVGPNLKDVRLKLRKEWIPLWLRDPQGFRPGTKMPTFWRFSKHEPSRFVQPDKDADDQIRAISAYLWQESFAGAPAEQARGNAARGKELFENRGCLACHSIGEGDNQMGGTFAANLQKVGEKSNFNYIVRWVHNPRERWAPYCPKEKRDLTPEDYSKHNKPYVFDTELNSRCPNDGTELQVQNMTVMPNFRLSDADARDIATYLFTLSSPPSYEDASFMDDANLKAKGHALIKQYGCAGCHEIKGFEEEQRIGKELTVEGATPIERLDFALLTHDAMQGHDPLKLHGEGEHDEKPWYNHKGFFERKLTQPSIYDKDKEKDPKDKLRMPEPYLTPEWRTALTTFLLGSVANEGANVPVSFFYDPEDQRRQDVQNGWWVIKKYNCMGCHQLQVGQRSVLMDVPIYETPEGKDFLPPRLTSEGARVDPNWLLRFLSDPSLSSGNGSTIFAQPSPAQNSSAATISTASASSEQRTANTSQAAGTNNNAQLQANGRLKPQPGLDRNGVRPYLKARMPTFNFSPNELQVLVRFFMAMSGQQEPYIKEPLQPLTEREKLVARQMFTSGTPCLKCHITGDAGHDATAIAPNFVLAPDRLKPDWTFRWLLDPAQISPGTAMPSGLFRKEGERWVINLPNPPASANAYMQDHAQLLVRYMLLMTPEEQRRLLATPPAQPAAATTQAQARKKRGQNTQAQSRRRKRNQSAINIRGSTSDAARAKVALKNILIWRI